MQKKMKDHAKKKKTYEELKESEKSAKKRMKNEEKSKLETQASMADRNYDSH